MIRTIAYGYLPKRARTIRQLEYFEDCKKPSELLDGKRAHEDIVKVEILVKKV